MSDPDHPSMRDVEQFDSVADYRAWFRLHDEIPVTTLLRALGLASKERGQASDLASVARALAPLAIVDATTALKYLNKAAGWGGHEGSGPNVPFEGSATVEVKYREHADVAARLDDLAREGESRGDVARGLVLEALGARARGDALLVPRGLDLVVTFYLSPEH